MATNQQAQSPAGPGGFFPQSSLPSPAPSNLSTASIAGLPHPRTNPLRAGSAKEDNVRRFIERQLNLINRRAMKKTLFQDPEADDVVAFRSMGELCKDLDVIVNILWQTGTPSLQVPYFLNIANGMTTWLAALPPSLAPIFSTLHRIDHCFASLLVGKDVETGETLPGFVRGPAMSRTDMVRCRSLVEQTRILMVEVMRRAAEGEDELGSDGEGDETETTEDEDTTMDEGADGPIPPKAVLSEDDDEEDELQMDAARVYEKTLVRLGAELGEGLQPIGIVV